jgi:predicted ATPase
MGKGSPNIEFILLFGAPNQPLDYKIRLVPTVNDELFEEPKLRVVEEIAGKLDKNRDVVQQKLHRRPEGADEAGVSATTDSYLPVVANRLRNCRVYHFHDTSDTAVIKGFCDKNDNRILRPDGANLAAFLYYLRLQYPTHFANIEATIRQIAPFFEGFNLEPSRLNEEKIRLEWKEIGSDDYFNASSLSDGTLRFICLSTLLLQPHLPMTLVLDEPELGLHPAAITLLAGMLHSASRRPAALGSQIIVATQSVTLVNQFEPGEVWTAERNNRETVFKQLGKEDMSAWLDDYSLGEMWEKNLLGARP